MRGGGVTYGRDDLAIASSIPLVSKDKKDYRFIEEFDLLAYPEIEWL